MDVNNDVAQLKLLALYPLMIPFGNITFSQFIKRCEESYSTFSLKDEYTFLQYLDEMLKRALDRETANNKVMS